MKIRHSLLPKLAACGQYEGSKGGSPSPAAQRGTLLDDQFRYAWTHSEFPNRELSEEDANVVRWAINECLKLGGVRDKLVTDEALCKVQTLGIDHVGTADGVALNGRWSIDLKSGQIYSYKEQMAAYAAGFMEMLCESTWTTHLLFCDQKKVITHEWTYESARAVIQAALDNVGKEPTENDYCGWCAKSLTCGARIAAKDSALAVSSSTLAPDSQGFVELLNDPERLGLFLRQCSTLDAFRDAAKDKARLILEGGGAVPGWKLQRPRVTEFVQAEDIASAVEAGTIGAANAINAFGNLSAKKAASLWSEAGAVFPAEMVQTKSSNPALVATK